MHPAAAGASGQVPPQPCLLRLGLGRQRQTAAPTKRWRFSTTRSGKRRAAGVRWHRGQRARGGTSHPPHPGSPHRLLWPKSKSFDYLYAVGEKLLQNFPVQATLCLYEDSGSEEDEEEEDEEEEAEAGAMPAGPPPHADSAARPA